MKCVWIGLFLSCMILQRAHAQQPVNPNTMSYILNSKPNNIFFRDTLYKGSTQFKSLFYRTRDQQLIQLYQKHQSNKITGQVLGTLGTLATIFGVGMVGSGEQKSTGWALIGGGFASMLTGGYLTMMGQRNLFLAVNVFNTRYQKAGVQVSMSTTGAGIIYQF